MNPIHIPFLLLLPVCLAGCGKEELKPDSDYAGHLTMEYIRSFPEFTSKATISTNLYSSGKVVFAAPDQGTYSALDSLPGEGGIKIGETGTITVSSLNGAWTVRNNTGYLTVNAHVVIEGIQRIWTWDSQAMEWSLDEENPVHVENPVSYPLEFKMSEAEQANGSVLGVYLDTEHGSIIYQWTLHMEPV